MCDDLVAGGEYLGDAAWGENQGVNFGVKSNNPGWDNRLYFDLRTLNQEYLVVPNELFYIRTEQPDGPSLQNAADWQITIDGLVASPVTLHINDLLALAVDQGVALLECSGNGDGGSYFGLMSAAQWGGVPVQQVFDMVNIDAAATRVLIEGNDDHSTPSIGGHSDPGASWVFTVDELNAVGAFFATEMNGVPLPPDHGAPVRLFIPGWYGCCNIKWVERITFVDDNVDSTSQMREFASRTHQSGTPSKAIDFIPATLDQTAVPIRVEKWLHNGAIVYRVVGIMWGGYELAGDRLLFSGDGGVTWQPTVVCPTQKTNRTWTLWETIWTPASSGVTELKMAIDDPNIPTRRLDFGWYDRLVFIDEV